MPGISRTTDLVNLNHPVLYYIDRSWPTTTFGLFVCRIEINKIAKLIELCAPFGHPPTTSRGAASAAVGDTGTGAAQRILKNRVT